MRDIGVTVLLALVLTPLPAAAGGTAEQRKGYAYNLGTDQLLYTEEHHEHLEQGRVTRSEVVYRKPEGGIIARKRLDFRRNASDPDFRLENAVNGHLEGASQEEDRLLVFFRKTEDHALKERKLRAPDDAIIDGGFDRFIENNWTSLMQGEVFERPFLVPSFQRFLEFRIYLERMTDTEVVFIMEPASMLLRFFGDGIVVAYDRDSTALRRYEGVSNIRDKDGENYEVRVEFPAAGQTGDVAGDSSRDRSRR
ncbi:MAG: hypothetical protein U5R46_05355 [Gammaproteobacteria bacterium]|nr:hypothetical protein [Gammaproteobacteria bacterium]